MGSNVLDQSSLVLLAMEDQGSCITLRLRIRDPVSVLYVLRLRIRNHVSVSYVLCIAHWAKSTPQAEASWSMRPS